MITFKYNNKLYKVQHLKNKLKKLGITEQDIEIIPEIEPPVEYQDIKLYYFLNKQTNESITSIYPKLDCYIKNANDYEQCTKDTLEKIWNKSRTT